MADSKERVFQSYLDNIQAKTGRTPNDFIAEAAKRGLTRSAEILAWLQSEHGLGLGHARALDYVIRMGDSFTYRSSAHPGTEHSGALILDGSHAAGAGRKRVARENDGVVRRRRGGGR